ncbi:MAG: ATP:cob(I)alamin adenosyltransferase, partial [Acidimicrobiia bacterium]|nr:ATP:cob(I)alamin adenosyltransferase [Acidimicrobiia bacterium]
VVMGELATAHDNRAKLDAGVSLVTVGMVDGLEPLIDDISSRFEALTEFVVPGQNRLSALLDVARTAVRAAERRALGVAAQGSYVVPYLNRLSDLLWTVARWQEGQPMPAREP